ncbi:zinc-binding dehydrogenase [Paenarthrobacter sp. RAF9]
MWVTPVGTELQELVDLVDQENFQVEVAQTFPLAQAAEAFRLNMEGHTRGKVVVTVS